jgi:hypothetical protein
MRATTMLFPEPLSPTIAIVFPVGIRTEISENQYIQPTRVTECNISEVNVALDFC